jgi:16S rRNA (uracil1498-N3)-methyltransferase
MRVTRIYVPGPLTPGEQVLLPAQAGEHLTRVLRLEPGAALTLFNGAGGEYSASLGLREGKKVMARVLVLSPVDRESPLEITLLQGVARGERMDLIVQKATELGVARIVPVLTERSVVRIDAKLRDRKREHWQAIATSACEQCGRNRVPEIADALAFGDALNALGADSVRCLLAADGADSLATVAQRAQQRPIVLPIVLLIGPEGGLADNEQDFARASGFVACRLGPRIMRTETAGLAALAALQALAGDLR